MILKVFKDKKGITFLTFVTLIIQVTTTLYIPYLVSEMINEGIATNNTDYVKTIAIRMIIVAIISSISGVASSYLSAELSARLGYSLREAIFHKFLKLSTNRLSDFGVSSLVNRTINDVDNITYSMTLTLQMILPAPLMCIVAIVMTYLLSPQMIWLPIAILIVYIILITVLMVRANKYALLIQEKMDNIMRSVREFFTGIRVIRAFDNDETEEGKLNRSFKDYAMDMTTLNQIFAVLTPFVDILLGISMLVILRIGAQEVNIFAMQIGSITAIVEYVTLSVMYLSMSAMVVITLPTTYSCILRIRQILYTPLDITDPDHTLPYQTMKQEDEPIIEFRDVSFSYPDAEDPVLTNINFKLDKGETLGIVGSTGSGKTTITKLIMRFNDVSSGQIRINGKDIRRISQNDLREELSLVPQKAFLFSGTIKENLLSGKALKDESRLLKAMEISQASAFTNELQNGYLSNVAPGGVNFSGGQRQRLAIARALTKESSLYIFDDSLSALDFKTEQKVRTGIQEMLKESATIIIAQRLSSIVHADRILVVEEGKIIAEGTHDLLLEESPVYRDFAISQNLIEN